MKSRSGFYMQEKKNLAVKKFIKPRLVMERK